MVNENIIPKTEIVYELKEEYKVPSFEEFMQSYKVDESLNYADLNSADIGIQKGYGPCNKVGCSCSCNGISSCSCRLEVETWIGEEGEKRYGVTKNSVEGKIRLDGIKLKVNTSNSALVVKGGYDETRFFGTSAGASASWNGGKEAELKVKAGIDLYNYEDKDGVKARVGLNVDTGISTENGLEAKLGGFGFSVGKKMGISTPLGEISKTDDNCIIQ